MPSPRGRRGGQPGNLNALKHGFYSKTFSRIESVDLETALSEGVVNEIAMLRVATRRLFEEAQGFEKDPLAFCDVLNALGLSAMRLASLERIFALQNGSSDVASAIALALKDITDELKLLE